MCVCVSYNTCFTLLTSDYYSRMRMCRAKTEKRHGLSWTLADDVAALSLRCAYMKVCAASCIRLVICTSGLVFRISLSTIKAATAGRKLRLLCKSCIAKVSYFTFTCRVMSNSTFDVQSVIYFDVF